MQKSQLFLKTHLISSLVINNADSLPENIWFACSLNIAFESCVNKNSLSVVSTSQEFQKRSQRCLKLSSGFQDQKVCLIKDQKSQNKLSNQILPTARTIDSFHIMSHSYRNETKLCSTDRQLVLHRLHQVTI